MKYFTVTIPQVYGDYRIRLSTPQAMLMMRLYNPVAILSAKRGQLSFQFRTIKALMKRGLVKKVKDRYVLTENGRLWCKEFYEKVL